MTAASPYVVRFAELPVSRWANGQGETVELWRVPASGDIVQRLSVAIVASAAPFSSLPGIDRALMPLAPTGLTVRVDADTHVLAQYETLYFSGDADAASVDVRQTSRDLNLMVRRGAGRPVLSTMTVGQDSRVGQVGQVGRDGRVGLVGSVGRDGQVGSVGSVGQDGQDGQVGQVGHVGQDVGTVELDAGEAVALIVLAGEPIFDGHTLSFGDTVVTGGAAVAVRGRGLVAVARVV